MKVKIVSNGTVAGTKIVDVGTGETLQGVVGVTWAISVPSGPIAEAVITLINVPLEFEGVLDDSALAFLDAHSFEESGGNDGGE